MPSGGGILSLPPFFLKIASGDRVLQTGAEKGLSKCEEARSKDADDAKEREDD